jgi:SAM-dependent methyltransferase
MPAMDYNSVAHLYDAYVDTTLDVQFFVQEARRVTGPVLELMSGTGRVSIPLLKAGARLTCVDSSPAMLEVFRGKLKRKGLSAELVEADVCALSLDRRFDLIFIPFHSFAEIIEVDRQSEALRCIREHLAGDGRFICTLHNPPVRLRCADGHPKILGEFPLFGGHGTLVLSSIEHYDATSRLVTGTQFYEIRDAEGQTVSREALDVRWFVHHREAFAELVLSLGYAPVALYGDYERAPFEPQRSPFMIWVLGAT